MTLIFHDYKPELSLDDAGNPLPRSKQGVAYDAKHDPLATSGDRLAAYSIDYNRWAKANPQDAKEAWERYEAMIEDGKRRFDKAIDDGGIIDRGKDFRSQGFMTRYGYK